MLSCRSQTYPVLFLRCQTRVPVPLFVFVDLGPVSLCNKPPAPSNLPHAVLQARQRPFSCWLPCSVVSCLPTVPLLINAALHQRLEVIYLLQCFGQSIISFSHVSITEAREAIQGSPKDGAVGCTGQTLAGKSRALPHIREFPCSFLTSDLPIYLFPYHQVSLTVLRIHTRSATREHRRRSSLCQSRGRPLQLEAWSANTVPRGRIAHAKTHIPAVSPEKESNIQVGTQAHEMEYVLATPSSV
jgi:hypothetical protein